MPEPQEDSERLAGVAVEQGFPGRAQPLRRWVRVGATHRHLDVAMPDDYFNVGRPTLAHPGDRGKPRFAQSSPGDPNSASSIGVAAVVGTATRANRTYGGAQRQVTTTTSKGLESPPA